MSTGWYDHILRKHGFRKVRGDEQWIRDKDEATITISPGYSFFDFERGKEKERIEYESEDLKALLNKRTVK